EAALLARAADALLRGSDVAAELERLEAPLADVLGVVSARIEITPDEPRCRVIFPPGGEPDPAVRGRLLPALASLVAVAADRDAQALDEVGPRGAGVAVELGDAVPPVRVDAVQIQRVLANLIENALKFSPGGAGVRVEVEAVDGEVRLHVVDRGPGIPPAERERVFEPFRRLDGAARGAGLGLAIARGFAQANGGRVWAEGAEGGDAGAHLVL